MTLDDYPQQFSDIDVKRLFSLSVDLLGVANFDGYFISLNPAWERKLGYTLDELYDQPFIAFVHPDDKRMTEHTLRVMQHGQAVASFENRYIAQDGEVIWLSWNAVPYAEEGLIYFVARDVTALKRTQEQQRETQERLRSTLASLDDLVFSTDTTGVFTDFYRTGDTSKLFAPPQSFLGKHFKDVLPDNIATQLEAAIQAVKETGEVQQFDYEFMSRNQNRYWFNTRISARYNAARQFDGVTIVARDITERKQAEAQIRHSRKLYHLLASNLPRTAVFLYDRDVRFVVAEGPELARSGLSREKVEGRTLYDVFPKQLADNLHYRYLRVFEGETVNFERYSRRLDRTYEDFAVPVYDEQGEITHGLLMVRDVTDQVRAKQEIQRALDRTQILYESAQSLLDFNSLDDLMNKVVEDVAQALKADRVLLAQVNVAERQVERFFMGGQAADQVPRPSFDELWDGLSGWVLRNDQTVYSAHEVEDERESEAIRQQRREMDHGDIIVVPLRAGKSLIGTLTVINFTDSPSFTLQDVDLVITLASQAAIALENAILLERVRQSERQYRHLLENASDIVYQTDVSGNFTYVSPIVERYTGYKPEELVGRNYMEFVPTEAHPQVTAQTRRQFEEQLEEIYTEYPVIAKDGRTIWIGQHVRSIFKDQRIIGFQGIARDITQRKEVEFERERLIEQLDTFAEMVAHDLKNPLNIISGYAEITRDILPPDSETWTYVDKISRATVKMGQIIDEFLQAARMRSQQDVQFASLDMADILDEALERLDEMIKQHHAQITTPDTWPEAVGHAPWVEEVWVNYISNAIKYGGSPPVIEIGTEMIDDYLVRFWIADNGPGLTPEEQQRLFKEFSRLRDDDEKSGHGLGLSIIKRLVTQMNGQVGVESTPSQGSRFWFALPRHQ